MLYLPKTTSFPLLISMKLIMFSMGEQFKVFNPIVRFISVNMVDMLRTFKRSSDKFFHDQPVFKHLLPFTDRDSNIPCYSSSFSVFPHRVFIKSKVPRNRFVVTGFGAILLFGGFWLKLNITQWALFLCKPFPGWRHSFIKAKLNRTVLPIRGAAIRAKALIPFVIPFFTPVTIPMINTRHNRSLAYVHS